MASSISLDKQCIDIPLQIVEISEVLLFLSKHAKAPIQMIGKTMSIDLLNIIIDTFPVIERPIRSDFLSDYFHPKLIDALNSLGEGIYEIIEAVLYSFTWSVRIFI